MAAADAHSHSHSQSNALGNRAAILKQADSGYTFEIQNLPVPEPGPSEVLVKLSATGLCGTDFSLASGVLGPCCTILGHEGVGRVVKIGSAVSNTRLGQLVGVAWLRDICGVCQFCLTDGGETRCAQQLNSGRKINGTFADYTIVPSRYLMPLQEGLSDVAIAPVLCGGVTMYKALKISGAKGGDWVVISGAGGGVGTLGIQFAKAMGFRVVATDAGEDKRSLCLSMGANAYIDVLAGSAETQKAKLGEITGNQGAATVVVVAGSGQAYQDALALLAPFGTLVCVGIPPPPGTFTFHPLQFIDNGWKIIGSAVGTRGDILEALDFVKRGSVVPVVNVLDFEKLPEVAEQFRARTAIGKYVVRLSPDEPPAGLSKI